jgi:hypothetical protein
MIDDIDDAKQRASDVVEQSACAITDHLRGCGLSRDETRHTFTLFARLDAAHRALATLVKPPRTH